jgi:hypothetical protein
MSGFKSAPVSSAAPAPQPVPSLAGMPRNKNAARDFAAAVRIARSSLAGRRCARKKMFLSDYPRAIANRLRFWSFPAFDALAVASALPVASLFATGCLAVLLLRLPPRPLPRLLPALRAAIALARVPRMHTLLAAFQQTAPCSRPPSPALPPLRRLIFARACKTLGRAHGR